MDEYITPLDDLNFDFESEDIIREAPGDDNADNDQGNDNANINNADNNTNDDQGNDNADDNNQDNDNNTDNRNDQENDDNFDVDVNDGDDNADTDQGNDNTGDTGNGEDNNTDDNPEESEESDEEKELNNRIDSIYNQLSPAEKQQRDIELRKRYKELYQSIDILINNTEQFPITSDSSELIKRLIRNLRDFKEYLLHYFTDSYSIKSYLENLTRYRQFVQIYYGIESIYKDLEKAFSKNFDRFGRDIDELNKQSN